MKVLIAGDLVPTKSNINLFNKADMKSLLGNNLFLLWNSVDGRIFNLEVPLVDKEKPIEKCGPNLIAPTSTIKGIKALNPSLITLANNHILDQGDSGLYSTQDILRDNNIPYVGIGKNILEASEPYILDKNGIKIGIYSCAEHEFSIANEESCGANPFDPLESFEHIHNLKNKCDYVIVLYHGGKEHYRYPSPYLQKICRKMVSNGANVVICQHSHCIGCYEEFNDSTIIYGQGNFIFDDCDNEYWNTSLIIELEFREEVNIKYIPIVKEKNVVRLASKSDSDIILKDFNKRSKEILEKDFIKKKYNEFAKYSVTNYLRKSAGMGKWISRLDIHLLNGKLLKSKYKKGKLLGIKNCIECEAHRELFLTGLQGEITSERR